MPPMLKLGYLAFSVRRPAVWADFCGGMLGLPEPATNGDGSRGYRLDEAAQRLVIEEGTTDDLAAVGLECADDPAIDRLSAKLRGAGLEVHDAAPGQVEARRVARLVWTTDPAGNRIELHRGPQPAATPFASTLVSGGFRTGDLGLGHAVLVARDLPAMEKFYVDLLGFAVTERLAARVGPIDLRGTFLHCNRRHHSMALFDLPLRKRLHHFMLQANEMADVGAAFERAARLKVPMSLGLGQHPDPDGTFSFYGETPSGFDFEIGAAGREIDPEGWSVQRTSLTSTWGHKPRLRLQLKMMKELVARRLGL
jgi:2,3-dihydroxybiphenyl 1,2-dioxygenase